MEPDLGSRKRRFQEPHWAAIETFSNGLLVLGEEA